LVLQKENQVIGNPPGEEEKTVLNSIKRLDETKSYRNIAYVL
jgi:hypothetical protein